jgi:hypothetical protein
MGVTGKTDAEVLTDVLATLDHPAACVFWACPGPDARFVNMATCIVCSAVQDLRKLQKRWERKAARDG